jgi:hypothetical protein
MIEYDLIICVFACDTIEKYKNQILKINETWGKLANSLNNVKLLYFLGEERTDLEGSQYINLPDVKNDIQSAIYKQFQGLKYIYENYKFKFVHCCGTDTYINIPKMLKYILLFNENKNLYIGGSGYERELDNKKFYFHDGGPGFIVSIECLKKLYPYLDIIVNHWINLCKKNNKNELCVASDVAIAYYLQSSEINSHILKDDKAFITCNHKGGKFFEIIIFKNELDKKNEISKLYNCNSFSELQENLSFLEDNLSENVIINDPNLNNYFIVISFLNDCEKIKRNNLVRFPYNIYEIICCHNMSLYDFDDYTRLLEENNYYL